MFGLFDLTLIFVYVGLRDLVDLVWILWLVLICFITYLQWVLCLFCGLPCVCYEVLCLCW